MLFALCIGNPFAAQAKRAAPLLLKAAVIGLGAGMNLAGVARAGMGGLLYTAIGIALTLAAGRVLARMLGTDGQTGLLVDVGTAICGGSAIAATAPLIGAKDHAVSLSLATVFFLNAIGLLVFPSLGRSLGLDETQFGLWAALAIHDTSSVVGAGLEYGPRALETATTVKLARALWIVPVALTAGALWQRGAAAPAGKKPAFPWFILGFLAVAALVSWVPPAAAAGAWISLASKRLLVLTLFLIGSGLTRATLGSVGLTPLAHGFLLWVLVATSTLAAILRGWIA
jgi:uncharacterized integral membrane protein (TIGR00698 family)